VAVPELDVTRSTHQRLGLDSRFRGCDGLRNVPSPSRERVWVRGAQKLPLILTFSPEGRRNSLGQAACAYSRSDLMVFRYSSLSTGFSKIAFGSGTARCLPAMPLTTTMGMSLAESFFLIFR
jgi:hypothetical protein